MMKDKYFLQDVINETGIFGSNHSAEQDNNVCDFCQNYFMGAQHTFRMIIDFDL